MRSRTPLALMEQAVMLLVFIFAAVLMVRVFAGTDQASAKSLLTDQAIYAARNTIEILKSGESSEENFSVYYDENWEKTEEKNACELAVTYIESNNPYLWKARVTVTDADGEVLVSLPAAGQKGGGEK